MHDRVTTSMRTQRGMTNNFPISMGHLIFARWSWNVLIEHIQDSMSWCMLFTDDIILAGESRKELNRKLALWREKIWKHMSFE